VTRGLFVEGFDAVEFVVHGASGAVVVGDDAAIGAFAESSAGMWRDSLSTCARPTRSPAPDEEAST